MQPNTSFRFHMCISPLMSRLDFIPFFPCTNPLHRQTFQTVRTGPTSFLTQHPVRHLLQYVSVNPKPQLATSNRAFCHRRSPIHQHPAITIGRKTKNINEFKSIPLTIPNQPTSKQPVPKSHQDLQRIHLPPVPESSQSTHGTTHK